MEGIRLNEAKHESYLQLWRGRVMECRNSGKLIAVWCEEQGINIKTYYYWEKRIVAEASRQANLPVTTQSSMLMCESGDAVR